MTPRPGRGAPGRRPGGCAAFTAALQAAGASGVTASGSGPRSSTQAAAVSLRRSGRRRTGSLAGQPETVPGSVTTSHGTRRARAPAVATVPLAAW